MEKNKRYQLGFGIAMAIGAAMGISLFIYFMVDGLFEFMTDDPALFFKLLFSDLEFLLIFWLPLVSSFLFIFHHILATDWIAMKNIMPTLPEAKQ